MRPSPLIGNLIYFAYGANLCRAHMSLWCPDAEPLVRAVLPHWRLVFRTWADLAPAAPDRGQGALYEVGPHDLASLERFEDYPQLYHRLHVRVITEMGPVEALTYQMNAGHPLALPDEDYLNLLLEGYEDWGLDAQQLAALDPSRMVQ
jgi:gamma-glutamylcyclotransferase (GGCT)/AIG2-like uncharacterized protein YtfP